MQEEDGVDGLEEGSKENVQKSCRLMSELGMVEKKWHEALEAEAFVNVLHVTENEDSMNETETKKLTQALSTFNLSHFSGLAA